MSMRHISANSDMEHYLSTFTERCQQILGQKLCGVYLCGSSAQRDYRHSKSDLDLFAVTTQNLVPEEKNELITQLNHKLLPVPASGLDFLVFIKETVRSLVPAPQHELWFSTGAKWPTEIDTNGQSSEHLILFAICRAQGKTLFGPNPTELFAPVPEKWLLQSLIDVLTWHQGKILDSFHDPLGQYSVLNACRAWKYAGERQLVSKRAGAEWVLQKEPQNILVKNALAIRNGAQNIALEYELIEDFLVRVIAILRHQNAMLP